MKSLFLNSTTYISQLIGILGPLIILRFPNIFYIIVLIASSVFVFVKNEEDSLTITKKQRIILFLIFLIQVSLISTILYITWNNPKSNNIAGLQGRYFITPALLLMFSVYGLFNIKSKIILKIFTLIFSFSLFFYSVYTIHTYYYEKEHLVVKPTGNELSFNPFNNLDSKIINLTILEDDTLNSSEAGSNIIIKIPANTTGISWVSTAKKISWVPPKLGFIRVYYNISDQAEEYSNKYADWVPVGENNKFFVNLNLLEKEIDRKINGIMILPTNSSEKFEMSDFKFYY